MSEVIIQLCQEEKKASDNNNVNLHNQILQELGQGEIATEHNELLANIISSFDDDELYKIQVLKLAERFNFNQDELLSSFL